MSDAETLRRAASLMREDCPIPARSRDNDFIDYPTGFAIQGRGGIEHSSKCSGAQTKGALLCDCEAIYPAWRRWRAWLAVANWLDGVARMTAVLTPGEKADALAVATAYLGATP